MDYIAKQNGKKIEEKSLETAAFLYGCFLRVYINFYNKINNPKSIRRVKGIIKIGEPLPGKWVVMTSKKKNIQIVIHTVENVKEVFYREDVIEFWEDKMMNKISKVNLAYDDKKVWLQQMVDK